MVLMYVRSWVDTNGHSAAGRIRSMINLEDPTGNRNREIPACGEMCQRNAPRLTPCKVNYVHKWRAAMTIFLVSELGKQSGQLHATTTLPLVKNAGTHWIGLRVGLRAGVDILEKRKIPLLWILTPDRSVRSLSAIPTKLSWFPDT